MKLYLVDASGFIFRYFYAVPPMQRPSDGLPCNAIHGFAAMLWRLHRGRLGFEAPTHVGIVFDASRASFRHGLYDQYKAQRPPTPDAMRAQMPYMRRCAAAFGLRPLELHAYEADDIIATLALQAERAGGEAIIVSGDKDLMQLIGPGITIYDAIGRKTLGYDAVVAKFGVGPDQLADVLALMGDASDNIPGVPSIGAKTAAKLISQHGDLETLLANAHTIAGKTGMMLRAHADDARLSRQLVELHREVPLDGVCCMDDLRLSPPDAETLLAFLDEMEFPSLKEEIANELLAA